MNRTIATLSLLWILAVTAAQAQPAPAGPKGPGHPPPARSITVSGTGRVESAPDRARVQLTVQRSNAAMDAARNEALAAIERVLALTRKLGIEAKQVRSTSALVNPEYRWEQASGRQILTGYSVQRQFEIEVVDLDKLGPLIEGAVSAGVNNVSPPMLFSSNRVELNRKALAAAATDAEKNARAIAETLGVRLGSVRELVAADATPPAPMPLPRVRAAAAMMESADTAATYEPGTQEIEARVNATFDLMAP